MRFGLISLLAVEVPLDQRVNSAISAHLKATCTQRAKLAFDVTVVTAVTGFLGLNPPRSVKRRQ